jgi:hypothetical protein
MVKQAYVVCFVLFWYHKANASALMGRIERRSVDQMGTLARTIQMQPPDDRNRQPLPPPQEVRKAWSDPAFRGEVTYELIRSVRKVGSFRQSGWLVALGIPGALTDEEALQLYEAVRREARRPELEWRGEFQAAFPDLQLPPVSRNEVLNYWEQTLFDAIVIEPNLPLVREALAELAKAGIPITTLSLLAKSSLDDGDLTYVTKEFGPEKGLTLREAAERLGHHEIAQALAEAELRGAT